MTEPSKGFTLAFSTGSLDVLVHCEQMIRDARQWAQNCDWAEQLNLELGSPEGRTFYAQQLAAVEAMAQSLYYCMFRLVALASTGGGMEVYADGERDLFWRVNRGLHGGLNFHANRHGEHRLPTGLWSLNT